MKIEDLILALENSRLPLVGAAPMVRDMAVSAVYTNAAAVTSGSLFVAIPGFTVDGHDYIEEAVSNGAAVILAQRQVETRVPVLVTTNSRRALSAAAAEFYGHPSRSLHVTGITGTNGKTTISYILENMLAAAGLSVGVIGTVNYRYGGNTYDNPVTTPDALDLQRILAAMRDHGVTHVVMEVSSHAIDLHRVADCLFDTAVFTNLTQDHLDYHGDMECYWRCKRDWFTVTLTRQNAVRPVTAVINHSNPRGRELSALAARGGLTVLPVAAASVDDPGAVIVGDDITLDLAGIRGALAIDGIPSGFVSSLVGRYNLENILCAAGAARAAGVSPAAVCAGIRSSDRVPGRLDPIPDPAGRHVYVDYAHTPDALENVLGTLSALATGRIVTVFGCGGDRDRAKRPLMGEIAGRYSDLTVITSDNPRSEPPGEIIDQIVAGVRVATGNHLDAPADTTARGYTVEPDRKAAIALAVRATRTNDILLIAGKGHETYQILADGTIAFDDRKAVLCCLGTAVSPVPGALSTASRNPWSWNISALLAATGGRLLCGSRENRFARVFTDSRAAPPADGIFLALKGDQHDGHHFADDLVKKGTIGLIVSLDAVSTLPIERWRAAGAVCIGVPDTLAALGDLGRYNRRRGALPVTAITGSNGKTTTKEMTAAVVGQRYHTLASRGNFNNEIGLPLTLLDLSPGHTAAVLELGMNHAGEMDRLGAICEPDIAVITNVGPVHLEGLGSIEGVMHAKGELLAHLRKGGTAILNADDPHVFPLAATTDRRVVTFGLNDKAHIRAEAITTTGAGLSLGITTPAGRFTAVVAAPGRFMVYNALAAAAVGHEMGISNRRIATGLGAFRMPSGRLNLFTAPGGFTLIDDTYNANPVSMMAAIDSLVNLKKEQRGVLVAGDMFELGERAADLHREVGLAAGKAGLFHLFATGANAPHLAAGACEAGMPARAVTVGSVTDIVTGLTGLLQEGDWVLIKGSRGMRMERVVNAIKGL